MTYKPGQIAMVTAANRREEYRAFFDGTTWRELDCHAFCVDTPVTLRPLVVLDLDDFAWAASVLRDPKIEAMGTRRRIAEQIEEQTPTPITEGTLAKVTANTLRSASVVFAEWSGGKWRHAGGDPVNFGSGGIKVVEIVREGVPS